jgi:hypothetical protein
VNLEILYKINVNFERVIYFVYFRALLAHSQGPLPKADDMDPRSCLLDKLAATTADDPWHIKRDTALK